jgi:hypothetical protein
MNTVVITKIHEAILAEYIALMRYTSAWHSLETGLLVDILDPLVEFDAPGIPFNVIGLEKVMETHKLFFDNLRDMDNQLIEKSLDHSCLSSYNVLTQIYPYECKGVYPFMQLSYFTQDMFMKVYYFFVELDEKLEKITRIKTHHVKFLVDTPKFNEQLHHINSFNGLMNISNYKQVTEPSHK